jgi:hypothetical protein
MRVIMKGHKQDYFVLLLAVILVIIVFAIVSLTLTEKPASVENIARPTPIPTEIQSSSVPVIYDYSAQDRLAKMITNRPQLSPDDSQKKTTILNNILHGFNSGVLYETANVRLEYVQSADILMAEIKTTSIVKAKAETNTWLLDQGFTQDGICKLPVMFYLDPEVRYGLQGKDVIFSPLPNNC